jgi:hypothetical protein
MRCLLILAVTLSAAGVAPAQCPNGRCPAPVRAVAAPQYHQPAYRVYHPVPAYPVPAYPVPAYQQPPVCADGSCFPSQPNHLVPTHPLAVPYRPLTPPAAFPQTFPQPLPTQGYYRR